MYVLTKVKDAIGELFDSELIGLWNEYCENSGYDDDYIYHNDINELCWGLKPSEVYDSIDIDKYNPYDTYAVDTIYGYKSFNYSDDDNSPIDIDMLANYIVDHNEAFGYLDEDEIVDKSRFTDFDVELLADMLSPEDIKEVCDRNEWEYDAEDEDSMLVAFKIALYTIAQDEDEEQLREHLIRVLCPTVDEDTIEGCAEF